jgi:hypothetical protein
MDGAAVCMVFDAECFKAVDVGRLACADAAGQLPMLQGKTYTECVAWDSSCIVFIACVLPALPASQQLEHRPQASCKRDLVAQQHRRALRLFQHGIALSIQLFMLVEPFIKFTTVLAALLFPHAASVHASGASHCCSLRERRRCVAVLLCGTSGSGKSTLASILVSLQTADIHQPAGGPSLFRWTV